MRASIEIVPYDAKWPPRFVRIAQHLLSFVPSGASLHHIGSTAVPGLASKDVIDIQISVGDLDAIDIGQLADAGFNHIPNRIDHLPPGQTLPSVELRKLFFKSKDQKCHVHIRQRGRFNQRYALLCRDYLRAFPLAAAAYERIKRELATRFPDDESSYYAIKDPVFDLLMAGAELWADKCRWSEPPPDVQRSH